MDPSNQDEGHRGGRRSRRRPPPSQMKFMFIDSTSQGTNAKPNKAVRSFVMHQARRSKPWSTRTHKNADGGPADEPTNATLSPSQPHNRADAPSYGAPLPSPEFDPKPSAWNDRASPGSSDGTNSRSGSLPINTPPSSHGSVYDVPFCDGDSCGQAHTALARQDGFALGIRDPFDCLPVHMDKKTSSLLDHFVTSLSPRLIPLDLHQSSNDVTSQWVGSSLRTTTSPPFTYALLTAAAHHLRALGARDVENSLVYKAKAISEINNLLSDAYTGIDDNNIAAVFMLLCLEESAVAPGRKPADADADWSEIQREVHLNGLRSMIQQRGGLAAMSSNRCLQVFILMHSMAHSISTFQPPYAILLDSNDQPQKYDLPSFGSRTASARVLKSFGYLRLDPDLLEIISDIVIFTGDMNTWYEERKCAVDPLELQKHACLLNYRLFDWYTKPIVANDQESKGERSPIDQCTCLALLIFLVNITQPYDPSYRAIILLTVKKLRIALEKASIFRWAMSPAIALWTLTMGALAAQGSSEAHNFSELCKTGFRSAGLDESTTTDELLGRMRNCPWIPMLLDPEARKLWVRMELAIGEEVDVHEDALVSPEIKEDDVVGLLTSTRFFPGKTG